MNINRDYLLILDVKSGNLTVPTMYFINTDRGTSNIYLQLIVKNTDIKVSPLENATNYKVKANIVKSGGIIKFIEGVLVNEEDAIYEFNLPVDCINLSGAYRIEFEVSADVGENQERITSFSTKYYVKRSILAEINEEIEDGDDYPLIVKLLAKIEELEKDSETRWIAENERIANEELRVQAESERLARYTLAEEKEAQRVIDEEARINAENERLAKEEDRVNKELDRVAKENERLAEEEIRKNSEITRVLNETTRVANEEARVEAENIRLPKYLEAEEKEQARLSAEEQRIANENIRVANENDRISAESIRDSKEADRLNSEIFRLTNESNRLENETLRTNNEATRINSELTRVDNERNRVVSEKARVNSEEIRRTNENNRKIYESNREKAEQLRESNELIRQEGYTLMTEQMNNLGTTLSQYALISYVDDEISKIQVTGGGESYTHPSTHPASMITGLSTVATTGDYNDLSDKPNIPTKTSQLTNDSGYITEAELNGKGYATTSQIPTVPTNVSAFTNDANYATETYVASKIAEAQLGGGSESSGTFIDDTTTATDKTWSSSKIDSQIKDIENNGVTTEVVEAKVQSVIDEKIADGTMANLTIADGSITKDKLDPSINLDVENNSIGIEKLKEDVTKNIYLPIVNIIKNGNFIDTSNWLTYGNNKLTVKNNIGILTATNTGSKKTYVRQNFTDYNIVSGKKLFIYVELEINELGSNGIILNLFSTGNISSPFHGMSIKEADLIANTKMILSGIVEIPSSVTSGTLFIQLVHNFTNDTLSLGKTMKITNFNIIDIDNSYGDYDVEENEIIEKITKFNNYIDGTQNRLNIRDIVDKKEYPPRYINKKVLFLGDSIMANYGVPELFGKLTGMDIINCAIGGTRMGQHNYKEWDTLSLYQLANAINNADFSSQISAINNSSSLGNEVKSSINKLSNLDFNNIDFIFIEYGTNDFTGSNVSIYTNGDYTSVPYALEYSISLIMQKYPHIKIFVITPIFRADSNVGNISNNFSDGYTRSNNETLPNIVNSIIEQCKKMHIPYCDNYNELQINKYNYAYYLNSDYVHPNPETGAVLIANRIVGKFESEF